MHTTRWVHTDRASRFVPRGEEGASGGGDHVLFLVQLSSGMCLRACACACTILCTRVCPLISCCVGATGGRKVRFWRKMGL